MGVGAGDWYSWGSPPTGLLQINWVYISTVPHPVQDQNEKKLAQPTRIFSTLKISGWVQLIFILVLKQEE